MQVNTEVNTYTFWQGPNLCTSIEGVYFVLITSCLKKFLLVVLRFKVNFSVLSIT